MRSAGLTINPGKVQLAEPKINLLGFVVDSGTLRPNEKKLRGITEYPCAHDVKSLQRYLGMIAFYRDFIPYCSEISQPLNHLLRKGVKWCWSEQQQSSFIALSKAVTENACPHLPDQNQPFVLQTDASDWGVGVFLLQEHDGIVHPVAFASQTLNSAECNYSVAERECLAIVYVLKRYDTCICMAQHSKFNMIIELCHG